MDNPFNSKALSLYFFSTKDTLICPSPSPGKNDPVRIVPHFFQHSWPLNEKWKTNTPFIYMGFDTFHASVKPIVIWTIIIQIKAFFQIPVLFFAHSF